MKVRGMMPTLTFWRGLASVSLPPGAAILRCPERGHVCEPVLTANHVGSRRPPGGSTRGLTSPQL